MDLFCHSCLFVAACCLLPPVSCEYNTTHASNLEDAILTNYKAMVRPSDFVNVSIGFGVYHINSLSNIDQELSLVGFLELMWTDSRLAWTPSTYGDISATHVKNSQIWTPPIVLANSADGIRLLSDDTDTETMPIRVDYSGKVIWLAAANYVLKCPVDTTYYPFDSQICSIKVSTWMYVKREVGLVNSAEEINTQLYEENGEWDLVNTGVSIGSRNLHGHGMSMAEYSVKLQRKHSYYILNMILPVVFTSLLGCLVFLLPMESGEKNGFALTILLSLSVIMTIVSDKIPPTSTHICILSVYLLCALSVSVIEVLVTVFIQRVYHKENGGRSPGIQLQTFARLLAKITRYSPKTVDTHDTDGSPVTPKSLRETKIFPSDFMNVMPQSDKKLDNLDHRINEKLDGRGKMSEINDERKANTTVLNVMYDFHDISLCLDKTCFYGFFFFTCVMTLTFLVIIAEGL